MADEEPVAFELEGAGSTEDGGHVILSGQDERARKKLFAIPREQVPNMVALLIDSMNRAADKAEWQATSNMGRDEKGPWMQVSGAGLFDGGASNLIRLVIEVGAMRLQLEFPKDKCREIGTALIAASAEEGRRN